MSVKTFLLHDTVTTDAVFGGASHQLGADGAVVTNGLHLVDVATDVEFYDRYQATLKNRPSVLNVKSGAFSKDKRSVSIARPYVPQIQGVVALTTTTFNGIRIELECHPLAGSQINKLRVMAAEFLLSTDADAFWNRGVID